MPCGLLTYFFGKLCRHPGFMYLQCTETWWLPPWEHSLCLHWCEFEARFWDPNFWWPQNYEYCSLDSTMMPINSRREKPRTFVILRIPIDIISARLHCGMKSRWIEPPKAWNSWCWCHKVFITCHCSPKELKCVVCSIFGRNICKEC